MSIEHDVLGILQRAVVQIQTNMDTHGDPPTGAPWNTRGENASGRTRAGFQAYAAGGHVRLVQKEDTPLEQLESGYIGEAPYDAILKWGYDKGINGWDEKWADYVANVKIPTKGTDRYQFTAGSGEITNIYTRPVHDAIEDVKATAREIILKTFENMIK